VVDSLHATGIEGGFWLAVTDVCRSCSLDKSGLQEIVRESRAKVVFVSIGGVACVKSSGREAWPFVAHVSITYDQYKALNVAWKPRLFAVDGDGEITGMQGQRQTPEEFLNNGSHK
jgi:hypothetical protein